MLCSLCTCCANRRNSKDIYNNYLGSCDAMIFLDLCTYSISLFFGGHRTNSEQNDYKDKELKVQITPLKNKKLVTFSMIRGIPNSYFLNKNLSLSQCHRFSQTQFHSHFWKTEKRCSTVPGCPRCPKLHGL